MVKSWLTKSRFLAGLQCRKRLWFEVNQPLEQPVDPNFAMMQGRSFDQVVRGLEPGVLVSSLSGMPEAIAATEQIMNSGDAAVLYQSAFRHGELAVYVDILRRQQESFALIEVKASTKVKREHLPDVTFQTLVLRNASVPVSSISIGHMNSTFVLERVGDYSGLLVTKDVTSVVEASLQKAADQSRDFLSVMALGRVPKIEMGPQCQKPYECPYVPRCTKERGEVAVYPVELLPRGESRARLLRARGFADLRLVPEDQLEIETHRRVRAATATGEPYFDPSATRALRGLPFPRAFLDFETVGVAVPEIVGTRPYEQLPFQWSLHVEAEPGDFQHFELLGVESFGDFDRLAGALLDVIPSAGPILVYNATFERSVLERLAHRLPHHATAIRSLMDRLFDLLPVTREAYYHRDMRGSWSIKKVLSTIAPEFSYEGLDEVQGGEAAQLAFLELRTTAVTASRRSQLMAALRAYCQRDTWGMLVLTKFLSQLPMPTANLDTGPPEKERETKGGTAEVSASDAVCFRAANKGDATAQYQVGSKYRDGTGMPKDHPTAMVWFRRAADQGHAGAQYALSRMYFASSIPTANEWARKAATQGHLEAQVSLALNCDLLSFVGAPGTHEEAIKWYTKAAEQGHRLAQSCLANKYRSGGGLLEPEKGALYWYHKAAEQGDASAQISLGEMYSMGEDTAQDTAEAARWYQKAAEQGAPEAQRRLGEMCRDGTGVPRNEEEACEWFQRATDQEDSFAQFELGQMYELGQGVQQSLATAAGLYRDSGLPEAQYRLGDMYREGAGVLQDFKEAMRLLRAAAENGVKEARFYLDRMYANGEGSPTDPAEEVAWYRDGADQDLPSAQFKLGRMHREGRGGPMDGTLAAGYILRAADQGHVEAANVLGCMYLAGQGVPIDRAQAAGWFRKAATNGHREAQCHLGDLYRHGWGLPQDDVEAINWYRQAAEQGHTGAQTSLDALNRR